MDKSSQNFDVIVVGGGAAGFFAAINIAEFRSDLTVAILERGAQLLSKVKVSGGGRCNVTHAQFVPSELVQNYPRGEKELLGPFHSFMTGDTIEWFEQRGVDLKIESDGRMFPVTDSSQTIIDCFLNQAKRFGVQVLTGESLVRLKKNDHWILTTKKSEFKAKKVVIATGSNPKIWNLLTQLGHSIVPPVASLFTFNIDDPRIKDLQGTSLNTQITVIDSKGKQVLESDGATLITHWGLSGPAILKLSAWGARELASLDYQFDIQINWIMDHSAETALEVFKEQRLKVPQKKMFNTPCFGLTRRFWQRQLERTGFSEQIWSEASNKQLFKLAQTLTQAQFKVNGKSTFKEEFVTAGGVALREVNFKTFESKICSGLYLAGEVLNIDAITGGFNFQNAWTGAFLVAKAICDEQP